MIGTVAGPLMELFRATRDHRGRSSRCASHAGGLDRSGANSLRLNLVVSDSRFASPFHSCIFMLLAAASQPVFRKIPAIGVGLALLAFVLTSCAPARNQAGTGPGTAASATEETGHARMQQALSAIEAMRRTLQATQAQFARLSDDLAALSSALEELEAAPARPLALEPQMPGKQAGADKAPPQPRLVPEYPLLTPPEGFGTQAQERREQPPMDLINPQKIDPGQRPAAAADLSESAQVVAKWAHDDTPAAAKPAGKAKESARPQDKASQPEAGGTAVVRDVRIGQHKDKIRIVLDMSAAAPYTVDLDPAERILVIELRGAEWAARERFTSRNLPLIESFAARETGTGARLVVALAKSSKILKSLALPPSDGKDARIVVDLALN